MVYANRDDLRDLSTKVDGLALDIKDMQGAMKLQNKMFDTQASKMVRRTWFNVSI